MPLYQWCCTKCKKSTDVLRNFETYRTPPTDEEVGASPNCPHHEWERIIGGNQSVVRGPNWGGGKGNW